MIMPSSSDADAPADVSANNVTYVDFNSDADIDFTVASFSCAAARTSPGPSIYPNLVKRRVPNCRISFALSTFPI